MVIPLRTQYDFTLTLEGKNYGYFLWEDENGAKHWNEGLAPLLAPQQRTTEFSYEHIPPEIDVAVAFEQWTGGAGHTEFIHGTAHGDLPTVYSYSQGIDASWDNRLYLSPKQIADNASTGGAIAAAPSFFFSSLTFGFWCAAGVYLYKYDVSSGTWVLKLTCAAAVTSMAELNGVLYASLTDSAYRYTTDTDGTTWSTYSSATLESGNIADLFVVRNASIMAMYNEKAYVTTNGQTGGTSWSSGTTIGSTSETTQSLAVANGDYWIFKKEGIYSWDGTTVTDVWHPKFFNSDNGKYAYVWYDGVIYTVYNNRILGINPFVNDQSPMAFVYPPEGHDQDHDSTEIKGTISQITGTFSDLIFTVTNPDGRTYLMKGSPTTGVFHTFAYLGSVANAACFAAGTGLLHASRATVAVGTGTAAAHYILPASDLRPEDDPLYQFALTGTIYGPWVSFGARVFNKFLNRGSVLAASNSAGGNILLKYEIDEDTGTTTTLVDAQDPGINTTSTSSTVSFYRIRPVITINTVDSALSPILIAATFHSTLNPPRRRVWKPIISLRDNQFGRDGIRDTQAVSVLRAALFTGATNRITMTDRDQNSYTVRILDLQELSIRFSKTGGSETDNQIMQLTIAEVTPTTSSAPVARYGQSRYGAGYVYGEV